MKRIKIANSGDRWTTAFDENDKALAVLESPRVYSRDPYVITNVRTQEKSTHDNLFDAMSQLRKIARSN